MTLNRRYLRNFKSSLSFYISTGLITALVVYMFIAMSASYKAAKEHVDKSVRDTVREDGQFTLYNKMTDSDITDFEQEYNVTIDRISYQQASPQQHHQSPENRFDPLKTCHSRSPLLCSTSL